MIGINKIIKTFIFSDFLFHNGWGLIGPIFAIFITQQIQGGTIALVGLIAASYWLVKSICQPFIAHFLDVNKGEKDDFKFLIAGMYIANLTPLGYIFASQVWHIFLLEIIRGLAMAFVIPSWLGIFTRHIEKGWESFTWSIQSTSMGFAAAFAAAFGGIIAAFLGFKAVFFLVSFFGIIASSVLILIRHDLFDKKHFQSKILEKEKQTQF